MNTAKKGRRNENRMRDVLKKHGYYVIRSAGSFGTADLVAIKPQKPVLFLNCKSNMFAPPGERRKMAKLILKLNGPTMEAKGVLVNYTDGILTPFLKVYLKDRNCWKLTNEQFLK